MSHSVVEQIADAVLYEGYLLYPYRSSAVKNQRRWNFGVVHPKAYSEAQDKDALCRMQTECLAVGGPLAEIGVKVRFLRLVERQVGYLAKSAGDVSTGGEPRFDPRASMEIDGRVYGDFEEAAKSKIVIPPFEFAELFGQPVSRHFVLEPTRTVETVRDGRGMAAGAIVRTQERLECTIELRLRQPMPGLCCITVGIGNETPVAAPASRREEVLGRSLLSAHTILSVKGGEFVSLLEPPAEYQQAAAECQNLGTWPVLAGEPGQRDTMLSSPIILYDYPQVAPESPGDLFDGAEIDEILSLRILTLTDEEKQAMRSGDEHARRILERTEALPPEHFMKLHGALRGLRPAERGNE